MDSINILEKLISINTTNPPGNELSLAQIIGEILNRYNINYTIHDLGENRGNLIASIGNGNGPSLMFNGHLDVVPAIGNWKSDPFICNFREGRIYGRGTADMKGGLAAMISAAIYLKEHIGRAKGKLILLFVADEENANLGIKSYLKKNSDTCDYAIIGEPTNLKVAIAHRGVAREYILITGKSRHSALPELEQDSITRTELAIHVIKELNNKLKKITHPVLPSPSIAITQIEGYEKDNVVPGAVKLLLDFRILPGMTYEDVVSILKKELSSVLNGYFSISPHFFMPGGEVSVDNSFANLCLQESNKVLQQSNRLYAFDASCEQCFLTNQGVQAIILGPGSLSEAHTVDEFSTKEEIQKAEELYVSIINKVLLS